jgi:hypothetical protein
MSAALNNPNCAELMAQAMEMQVKSLNEQIALLRGYVPVPPSAPVVATESPPQETDKKKKKKKVVDPNRPKVCNGMKWGSLTVLWYNLCLSFCFLSQRSHSAYQKFIMDVLPKLKEEHPELTQRDIMSMGAKQWSMCPPEKKKELEAVASEEKAKYEIVLATYQAGLSSESATSSTSTSTSTSSSTKEVAAIPVVKVKKPRAKKVPAPEAPPAPVAAAVPVPVPAVSESVPVRAASLPVPLVVPAAVSAPVSVPVVVPATEEKKRKKEKKNKKEAIAPGEESAKKKKVCTTYLLPLTTCHCNYHNMFNIFHFVCVQKTSK